MLLLCASSYSLLAACLLFLFLGTCFPGPPYVTGFFLLFFWPSYQSVSDLFRSGAVSGLLVLSAAGVPGSLFPLRCFALDHVVSVPICSKVSSGLDGSSSSVVFRRLLLFFGLLWIGRPFLFLFSVSLFFGLFLGALLSEFSSSSPLVTSRLALSFCRRAPWSSLCCW